MTDKHQETRDRLIALRETQPLSTWQRAELARAVRALNGTTKNAVAAEPHAPPELPAEAAEVLRRARAGAWAAARAACALIPDTVLRADFFDQMPDLPEIAVGYEKAASGEAEEIAGPLQKAGADEPSPEPDELSEDTKEALAIRFHGATEAALLPALGFYITARHWPEAVVLASWLTTPGLRAQALARISARGGPAVAA